MAEKKESFTKRFMNFFSGASQKAEKTTHKEPQKTTSSAEIESYYDEISIPSRSGDIIYIRNYFDTGKHFLYQDNQKYTIIQAEIYRHDPNSQNVFFMEGGTPISFEIPVGMSLDEVAKLPMLKALVDNPSAHPDNLPGLKVNHLGKINIQSMQVEASSPKVDQWVQNNLTTKLVAEFQQRQAEYEEKHAKADELRLEQMKVDMARVDETRKREQAKAIEQSKTPKFEMIAPNLYELHEPNELKAVREGGLLSLELLPNTRGDGAHDVIRHRDGSREYVYSAYLTRHFHESDAHFFATGGPNVQFSLPYPIEQMYAMANDSSNPQYAASIAQMMEELITFPPPCKNIGAPYYAGGLKVVNGRFQWFDRTDIEKTIRLLGLDYDNRNATRPDGQNNGKRPPLYDDGSR